MILVDTTPLVALCHARDSRHRAAVKHLQGLARAELATCEAVLAEACFNLPHPAERQRLRAVIDELHIAPLSAASDGGFWLEVLAWLLKYADHEPDWADGCIAVLCGHDPGLKVWTYDREFRTTWRRPDGSVIPLATT
jgi:predicted nucleic acid-binding protein